MGIVGIVDIEGETIGMVEIEINQIIKAIEVEIPGVVELEGVRRGAINVNIIGAMGMEGIWRMKVGRVGLVEGI